MTSPEDDLCDLIAELDGLHQPWRPENEPQTICGLRCTDENGAPALWPCDTGKIVDKYKRRAHRRKYIVEASPDRNFAWGTGEPPTEYAVTIKPGGQTVHRADTPAECHTWIEQQYEENQ